MCLLPSMLFVSCFGLCILLVGGWQRFDRPFSFVVVLLIPWVSATVVLLALAAFCVRLVILTSLWCCYPTRLETRTKESNMCASIWVVNSSAQRNRLTDNTWVFLSGCSDSSDDEYSLEHVCWDPKDGELCLCRMKPGETLVEVRRDTDVQIVLQTWV